MPRHAPLASITALCLAACVVEREDVDTEDRAAGCFCIAFSEWTPAGEAPDFCGGDGTNLCAQGFTCLDDPEDDCDPRKGGVGCFGICVEPCGGSGDLQCSDPGEVCYEGDNCRRDQGDARCSGSCVPLGAVPGTDC